MDDMSKLDGWAQFFFGALLTFFAGLKSFFNLKSKVERDGERITALEVTMTTVRTEIRDDMKKIDDKLDRLIERSQR